MSERVACLTYDLAKANTGLNADAADEEENRTKEDEELMAGEVKMKCYLHIFIPFVLTYSLAAYCTLSCFLMSQLKDVVFLPPPHPTFNFSELQFDIVSW